jgi:solute carrier family 8 (sodium/calcium exchanger)
MSFLNQSILTNVSSICSTDATPCKPGLIIPVWTPIDNLSWGDVIARATVYALGLCYLFLGVSIISDRFMASIEVITSQEKEIHVVDANGVKQVVNVRYWNETVSNLTVIYFIELNSFKVSLNF